MAVDREGLLKVAQDANKVFVIPGGLERILKPVIGAASPAFSGIASAFSENIHSVVLSAGLPYMFALESSHRRRHQLLQCAAELEAVLNTERTPDPKSSHNVRKDVDARMRAMTDSENGRASLNHEACCVLLQVAGSHELQAAATTLVLQAAVLTWSALEVLCRDVFKAHLNANPAAYTNLAADSEVKKRFELARVPLQRVADLGFDLSAKLGELLAEQNDLADLSTIRVTLLAMFPSDERLRLAFGQRDLWSLFHRRNLIVHQRGIIDPRYREATGDAGEIGSKLVIAPRELMNHVTTVSESASALLAAVSAG